MTGTATHQIAVMGALSTFYRSPCCDGVAVTVEQLEIAVPIGRKQIATAVGKLIRRGYAERFEIGVYALTLTGRQALKDGTIMTSGPYRGQRKIPAYRDTLQQRAWAAMRLTPSFTIADIVLVAAKPEDASPDASLRRYFHRLKGAGYLVDMPRRTGGQGGPKIWRLVRNTGDQSPRWIDRSQSFRDFNTREVFPCE